jgi:predicted O-methyltransferase YrrM
VSTDLDFRLAETLLRYDYMWRFPQVVYDTGGSDAGMPAMWRSEIACIETLLLEEARRRERLEVVEWGSGYSTLHFSRFLRDRGVAFKWHAVENFVPWHSRVVAMIAEAGLGDSTQVHLRSPTFEDRKSRQEQEDLSAFIDFPRSLGHRISVALVDGRQRGACLVSAAQALEPDGVAILHDAERPAAHEAFEHFENRGRFVVENASPVPGGVQKLWIGRPRS